MEVAVCLFVRRPDGYGGVDGERGRWKKKNLTLPKVHHVQHNPRIPPLDIREENFPHCLDRLGLRPRADEDQYAHNDVNHSQADQVDPEPPVHSEQTDQEHGDGDACHDGDDHPRRDGEPVPFQDLNQFVGKLQVCVVFAEAVSEGHGDEDLVYYLEELFFS